MKIAEHSVRREVSNTTQKTNPKPTSFGQVFLLRKLVTNEECMPEIEHFYRRRLRKKDGFYINACHVLRLGVMCCSAYCSYGIFPNQNTTRPRNEVPLANSHSETL